MPSGHALVDSPAGWAAAASPRNATATGSPVSGAAVQVGNAPEEAPTARIVAVTACSCVARGASACGLPWMHEEALATPSTAKASRILGMGYRTMSRITGIGAGVKHIWANGAILTIFALLWASDRTARPGLADSAAPSMTGESGGCAPNAQVAESRLLVSRDDAIRQAAVCDSPSPRIVPTRIEVGDGRTRANGLLAESTRRRSWPGPVSSLAPRALPSASGRRTASLP